MPDASHDRRLCTNRAQARAQELQPMQRSISGVLRTLTSTSFINMVIPINIDCQNKIPLSTYYNQL